MARLLDEDFVCVARTCDSTTLLGPGRRAVVWVQGCPLRCRACVAPEALSFDGGDRRSVEELAAWVRGVSGVDGITLSGGEPFAQAGALMTLCELVRHDRPGFSVLSYSGYRREWLERCGSLSQQGLLAAVDILIDGPYVQRWHASLRWRGSRNQRIHLMSDRHTAQEIEPDLSDGVDLDVNAHGEVGFIGVPPTPGFRGALGDALAEAGLMFASTEDESHMKTSTR